LNDLSYLKSVLYLKYTINDLKDWNEKTSARVSIVNSSNGEKIIT